MKNFLPLFLFLISSSLTPGPNNLLVLNSGLNFGIKKSLPHFLGICLGFPMMVLILALGFGAIFIKYEWIRQSLKIVGSLYMLFLAWQIFKSSSDNTNGLHAAKPFSFLQAIIFQWVNPKAWLMGVGAISLFSLSPNYFNNAITISGLFLLTIFPCVGIWLVFGAILQNVLKNKKHQRIFNTLMAISLVASILLIFKQ